MEKEAKKIEEMLEMFYGRDVHMSRNKNGTYNFYIDYKDFDLKKLNREEIGDALKRNGYEPELELA